MEWVGYSSLFMSSANLGLLVFILKILLNDVKELREDLRRIGEKLDEHLRNHARGEFK